MIYGLGSGLAYPTWLCLWSANLDRGRESFQWSIYSTSTGLGTAATGAAGAAVATLAGFSATFLLAGLLCLLGCAALLVMERRDAEERNHPLYSGYWHSKGCIRLSATSPPAQLHSDSTSPL